MTPDGLVFYQRAKDLSSDLDELGSMFRSGQGAPHGRLWMDMPLAVARDVVIPRLPEFLAAHSELEVELSSTDRRVDLVQEGFDCVLLLGSLADSRLVARPLTEYRLISCASPPILPAAVCQ